VPRRPKAAGPLTLALVAFAALFGLAWVSIFRDSWAVKRQNTWSIVAVDLESGDVGAAGASCVPYPAADLAALVPGKGAAATQSEFEIENRDRVFELLKQGATASEIIESVADESLDPGLALRQYGAVTLHEGEIEAAGFTGAGNLVWAGDRQELAWAVSVQGNSLESEAVVADAAAAFAAVAAFATGEPGAVPLSDRLMLALEAGSAAGGDRRCNDGSVRQTAQSAFIAVSTAGQPPFVAPFGREPSPDDPALPWLYLSVVEPKGGENPLIELRRRYDAWRAAELPPCSECDAEPVSVPEGGDSGMRGRILLLLARIIPQQLQPFVPLLCMCVASLPLFFLLLFAAIRRFRKRPDSPG
jgi:uncharacterized Ntn-hydrolase superfamily protein